MYVCGMNNTGQLGLGDTEPRYEPKLVTVLQDIRIEKIVCGEAHTAAVDGKSDWTIFGIQYDLAILNYSICRSRFIIYLGLWRVVQAWSREFFVWDFLLGLISNSAYRG